MEKRELVRDMKQFVGGSGFITKTQFAQYMGIKDPHNATRWLKGLERVDGKYYFIQDIAASLKASSRY